MAPRLGLNKTRVDTVEWLVRYHLLMSDMAQKRDIADPRTVRDFAKAVQSVKRLDLLCVLTVCDIRGVGPDTWNNWKAVLIRALYRQTRDALENGMEALNRETAGRGEKGPARRPVRLAAKRSASSKPAATTPLLARAARHRPCRFCANCLRDMTTDEISIDLHPDEDRDATRACLRWPTIRAFSPAAGALGAGRGQCG